MTEISVAQHEILPPGAEEGNAGVQLALALEQAGALTATGLKLADPHMPFEQWVALGRHLGHLSRATRWAIGDWINFGEGVYGEKYAAAVEITGLSRDTLMNVRWVCERVPFSRRVNALPFSFHEAVAALEPDAQRDWLRRALEEQMSRDQFRDALRPVKAELNGGKSRPALGEAKKRAEAVLLEAAQAVVNTAHREGPDFVVPAEAFARLKSAVEGE